MSDEYFYWSNLTVTVYINRKGYSMEISSERLNFEKRRADYDS